MDFHVTIDFNDDLWYAEQPWDEEKLRGMVRAYAQRGIRALHWLDQGGLHDGIHDKGGYIDRLGTAWEFIQRVPDPLRVVADEAHRHDMRVFSVIKIFDLACGMPFNALPAGEAPNPPVGVSFVGGEGVLAHRWIRDNASLRAQLHPSLREKSARRPIRTIRLWHEAPGLKNISVKLLVSENNRNYRPYTGTQRVKIEDRRRCPPIFEPAPSSAFGPESLFTCIEISELALNAPFFAVTFEGSERIANTLAALAELEDTDGHAAVFTYGLIPVITPESRDADYRAAGVAFDAAINTPIPGRGWTFTESGGRHRFDTKDSGFLAFARGRNEYLGGVVELAYPQTRQWLTSIAVRAADAGCDGVDIRTTTHTESLDWENYGFGPPIIEELQRRGVDVQVPGFNRAAWRKLRGEYFEQLLQDIRDVLHRRGKILSAQISNCYERTPEQRCFHEIFFDWRKWCAEGMLDTANLTSFRFAEPFYREALDLCHRKQIPMFMTVAMWWAKDTDWASQGRELFDHCEQDGIGVFNIYESASVSRLTRNGFEFLCPTLWKMVEQYSARA